MRPKAPSRSGDGVHSAPPPPPHLPAVPWTVQADRGRWRGGRAGRQVRNHCCCCRWCFLLVLLQLQRVYLAALSLGGMGSDTGRLLALHTANTDYPR